MKEKIVIGSHVRFIAFNVQFEGTIMDIKARCAFVAVLGHPVMFVVSISDCVPLE